VGAGRSRVNAEPGRYDSREWRGRPGFVGGILKITLSKIKYGTRSILHFEALEQTLRLRLVSGHADK
jgi:hypothetical protein